MKMHSSRIVRTALAVMLAGALLLAGCAPAETSRPDTTGQEAKPVAIKIGTLATQDSLPLWVAEEKGYFASEGLPKVEIVIFQSAPEREAAFASGAIQGFMGDIIVAANLEAAGADVTIPTVMLGSDATQGRFAILAPRGTAVKSLADIKGVKVGTGPATVTEYVLDKLMEEAGIAAADVKTEAVPKVPVRFELLMAGKLKAAVLPEPFVTLAEQGGAVIIPGGDDTKAEKNISQSVLCVNGTFVGTDEGGATIAALLKAWDKAVDDINANPDDFRQTLVAKAMLPKPLASTFQVGTYPKAAAPTSEQVQTVLDWMKTKGYLKADVKPEDLIGVGL